MTFDEWWAKHGATVTQDAQGSLREWAQAAWRVALERAIEALEHEADKPLGDAPCSGAYNLGLMAAANVLRDEFDIE